MGNNVREVRAPEDLIMITPELRKTIEDKASEFQIDANLIEAFCMTESSGNPNAVRYEPAFYRKYIVPMNLPESEGLGRATSYGLMQIMGEVARELGFTGQFMELFDPATGLEYALKHLKHFVLKYQAQGLDYAIASYNAGSPRVGDDGKFVNQQYVDTVHSYWNKITG
jgi:soluble lytic murein transglycosylase-like protein